MSSALRFRLLFGVALACNEVVIVDPSTDAKLSTIPVAPYVNSLAADPYRAPGAAMSESARRGEAAFVRADCQSRHTGKYATGQQKCDIETRNDIDCSAEFDNPTLADLWRTAPYLHDGSAPTLKDVLTTKSRVARELAEASNSRATVASLFTRASMRASGARAQLHAVFLRPR